MYESRKTANEEGLVLFKEVSDEKPESAQSGQKSKVEKHMGACRISKT